jgi:replicative superfamily II helicase
MGFWALESVFSVFSERIRGGSHADLTDLTKIKLVSAKRARALFVSGFTTIEAVAAAEPSLLIKYARIIICIVLFSHGISLTLEHVPKDKSRHSALRHRP